MTDRYILDEGMSAEAFEQRIKANDPLLNTLLNKLLAHGKTNGSNNTLVSDTVSALETFSGSRGVNDALRAYTTIKTDEQGNAPIKRHRRFYCNPDDVLMRSESVAPHSQAWGGKTQLPGISSNYLSLNNYDTEYFTASFNLPLLDYDSASGVHVSQSGSAPFTVQTRDYWPDTENNNYVEDWSATKFRNTSNYLRMTEGGMFLISGEFNLLWTIQSNFPQQASDFSVIRNSNNLNFSMTPEAFNNHLLTFRVRILVTAPATNNNPIGNIKKVVYSGRQRFPINGFGARSLKVGISTLLNLEPGDEVSVTIERGVRRLIVMDAEGINRFDALMLNKQKDLNSLFSDRDTSNFIEITQLNTNRYKQYVDLSSLSEGDFIRYYCDGTSMVNMVSDGNGGEKQGTIEYNSPDCGYTPPLPEGTFLRSICRGFTYVEMVADGMGGQKEGTSIAESSNCGFVSILPKGSPVRSYCTGTTLIKEVADGTGGTLIGAQIVNSPTCGYAGAVFLPEGTVTKLVCQGTTLYTTKANGSGGETITMTTNSTDCGYTNAPLPNDMEIKTYNSLVEWPFEAGVTVTKTRNSNGTDRYKFQGNYTSEITDSPRKVRYLTVDSFSDKLKMLLVDANRWSNMPALSTIDIYKSSIYDVEESFLLESGYENNFVQKLGEALKLKTIESNRPTIAKYKWSWVSIKISYQTGTLSTVPGFEVILDCVPTSVPANNAFLYYVCDGTTLKEVLADGTGGTKDGRRTTDSLDCGYSPIPREGTVLSRFCTGVDEYNKVADGAGGSVDKLFKVASKDCGYVPGTSFAEFDNTWKSSSSVIENKTGQDYAYMAGTVVANKSAAGNCYWEVQDASEHMSYSIGVIQKAYLPYDDSRHTADSIVGNTVISAGLQIDNGAITLASGGNKQLLSRTIDGATIIGVAYSETEQKLKFSLNGVWHDDLVIDLPTLSSNTYPAFSGLTITKLNYPIKVCFDYSFIVHNPPSGYRRGLEIY